MSPQVKDAINTIGMVLAISILIVAIYFLVHDIVNHYKGK